MIALLFSAVFAAEPPTTVVLDGTRDAALAARVDADEHGMRRFVLATLVAGPNRGQSEDEATRIQRAHLDYIQKLSESGTLVLAGPFLDEGSARGVFVFAVDSVEEAAALTAADPAVQAGRLAMKLQPWYGSAALVLLPQLHEKVARTTP